MSTPMIQRLVHHVALAAAVVTLATTSLSAQQHAQPDRFAGRWQGVLPASVASLRLGLTVVRDASGAVSGDMISIDQGNARIPGTITLRGDSLLAEMPIAGIRYAGVLSAAGDSLRGTFSQGGAALPLNFGRVSAVTVAAPRIRPQTPKGPFPYRSLNVDLASVPGVRLAGTLLVPDGAGPFPAVVFVTGSGPQDRDEAIAGHQPFLVIADHLARHGIASLRYDDRGTASSTGDFTRAALSDFADDAEAAVRWLKARPEVDARHVGIIGHSEGGIVGPIVATRTSDVAFVVMMAGLGIPGDQLLAMQGRLIMIAGGMPADQATAAANNNARILAAVHASTDSADASRRAHAAFNELVADAPADRRVAATRTFETSLPALLAPEMRSILMFNPASTLPRVRVPVLAVNGSLDLQVPARENLAGIKALLESGGNHDVRTVELPGLNHLFQTATTGSPDEYAKIEETVSPALLNVVTSWVIEHTKKP